MNKPNTVAFTLSINTVIALVAFLMEQYESDLWSLRNSIEHSGEDEEADVSDYDVRSAERAIVKRQRIGALIESVTGEAVEDEYATAVVELRQRYEAQLARQREAVEVES